VLRDLYDGCMDTIIDSCLSGIMGEIITDERLQSAVAVLGDFCFPAGEPNAELLREASRKHGPGEMIIAARDVAWQQLIENSFAGHFEKETRYAISRDDYYFDREKLTLSAASLPEGYMIQYIDEELYNSCLQADWCRDFVSQYKDWSTFERLGLGVVALYKGEIVAGASSYSTWSRGIEIEVDTREDHRRKGLAYACSAALILACLERNWFPSWDAANMISVALAEKLGYKRADEYPIWIMYIRN